MPWVQRVISVLTMDPTTSQSHSIMNSPHSLLFEQTLMVSVFIVFNERGLHRTLKSYFEYYEQSRTHSSPDKDAPLTRAIHPPEMGRVIELPRVGGLHHRYERRAG